jgi:Flp pilus assembly protein CpaB
MVLPADGNSVGNYVQPGDHIDLIVSLGDNGVTDYKFGPDGEMMVEDRVSKGGNGDKALVEVLSPPLTKLVVQNLKVIRVDREPVRDPGGASNAANPAAEQERQRALEQAKRVSEVKRLYVEVTRDQYEVLGFVLNTGKKNFAVRSATGDTVVEPTEGVSWNDFMRWVYIQRNKQIKADSFAPASPYQPAKPSGQ